MFGAGSGSGAFATDMLILDDIAKEEAKRKKQGKSNCYNSVSAFAFKDYDAEDDIDDLDD
jgi:hypothetical protein